jgi:UDP-N-acetyl-2-amino-2-deoxyglucuronate dehydrogenase
MKFGIIGCGRIAQRHAEHINKRATLAGTCDIKQPKAEALADKYGARAYSSMEMMLREETDLDVLVVCTPNGHHMEHAISALDAGINVLCEKPMALSTRDCGEMIKAAERSNRRLFVVKQNRFNPPVAAVKAAVEKGTLGRLFSIQLSCFWNRNREYYSDSWKGSRALDGGTLFTQFSHFIDLLYWMIGDVAEVHAMTGNFDHQDVVEFEDTGVVALRFHNGVLGTINFTVNSYAKNMEGSLTIFGERGTVKIGGPYLNELEYQSLDRGNIQVEECSSRANDYGSYQGSMSNHDKVYDNLIDVFLNGASVSTNAYEGLKVVEIVEQIYRSASKGSRRLSE